MAAGAGVGIRPLGDADPRAVGPYRLTGRLGSGGMGSVFAGLDQFDRRVAIKIVHAQFADDREFRARFAREVALLRRVGGTCTTPVLDADVEAEQPWFACEYVPGPTLAERVDRQGPMSGDELFALAAGLAEALVALHGVGIVHRDLKPQNIVCSPAGPRVLDLGIARSMEDSGLTRTGMMIGSPAWMSPERFRGHNSTPAADVYAWAMLVAFAATGVIPFGTGAPEVVALRVLQEQADTSGVPGALRGIVEQSADKDPLRRPSAHDLLAGVTATWRGALGVVGAPVLDPVSDATQLIHLHWKDPAAQGNGFGPPPAAMGGNTVEIPGGAYGVPPSYGGAPAAGGAHSAGYGSSGAYAPPPYAEAPSVPPPPGAGPSAGYPAYSPHAPGAPGTGAYPPAGTGAHGPYDASGRVTPPRSAFDQADTIVGGTFAVAAEPAPDAERRRSARPGQGERSSGRGVGKPVLAGIAVVAVLVAAGAAVLATRGGDKKEPEAKPSSAAPEAAPSGTVTGPGLADVGGIKITVPQGWEARRIDATSICVTPLELPAADRADCPRGGLRVWARANIDAKIFDDPGGWTLGAPPTSCPGDPEAKTRPTGTTTGKKYAKVGELTYEYVRYKVTCAGGRTIEPQVWSLPISKISFSTAALPRKYDTVVEQIIKTADRKSYKAQ